MTNDLPPHTTPPSSLIQARYRGLVWGRETPDGLRAFGFDFGPFAIVILLDRKP